MTTWFTADTHFGHANIIRYCKRPFADVSAMNEELVERWNAVVAVDDVVYHLGDFAMGDPRLWPAYRQALRGRITLVRGNHDAPPERLTALGFQALVDNVVVEVSGVRCWLNHFPPSGSYQDGRGQRPPAPGFYDLPLCGHVHHHWLHFDGVVNVGVDQWRFQPVNLVQILATVGASSENELRNQPFRRADVPPTSEGAVSGCNRGTSAAMLHVSQ